jgi:hypothetical protein
VSPVRYDMGFISQKTAFFIVTAVKTSNLTLEEFLILFRFCAALSYELRKKRDKFLENTQSQAGRLARAQNSVLTSCKI